MKINYYRKPNLLGEFESWQNCQFTPDTDLSTLNVKPLVTINGQQILRQHHSTYLTGKETCRAHHFAKQLAIQVLNGNEIPTSTALTNTDSECKVLWIDTLHGPHVCASIYRELVSQAIDKKHLHFVCLDILGEQRDNCFAINRQVEALIHNLNPALVVIDDIDHFMPFCGVRIATEFCRIVRDVTNHTETAFLFIGYNHLSKKASTTGNLGKYLFLDATDVFSLSTQHEVTTVRLVRSYDLSRNPDDTEYRFTIGPDNLPHEAKPTTKAEEDNPLTTSDIPQLINTPLTLPPHPFTASPPSVNNPTAAACPPSSRKPTAAASSSSSSTPTAACPVVGGSAAENPSNTVKVLQASGLHTPTNKNADANKNFV
jgi:hypothetical protein